MNVPRNPYVLSARMRTSGGPMHDRRQPRGGARNDQREYLEELYDYLAEEGDLNILAGEDKV